MSILLARSNLLARSGGLDFPWFLAEVETFRHLGRHFQPGNTSPRVTDVLVAAVAVILIAMLVVGLAYWNRARGRHRQSSPRALFKELCQAHGFPWPIERRLWRLAHEWQAEPPAAIFLNAALFDSAASALTQESAEREELLRLRETLFGPTTVTR